MSLFSPTRMSRDPPGRGVASDVVQMMLQSLLMDTYREPTTISEADRFAALSTVNQIIALLQANPGLALEEFYFEQFHPGRAYTGTPLQAFLKAGVGFGKIVELAAKNPQTIEQGYRRKGFKGSLLEYAIAECKDSVSAEDLVLIARQWPGLLRLKKFGEYGLYPLSFLLQQRGGTVPLEVVQCFVKLFPEVMVDNPGEGARGSGNAPMTKENSMPLQTAINNQCRIEVIRFLISRYPKHFKAFSLSRLRVYPTLGLDVAMEVCKLLPQVETFILWVSLDSEALVYVLTSLQSNRSIQRVELLLPFHRVAQNKQILLLLQELNKETPNNRHIHFARDSIERNDDQHEGGRSSVPILNAITSGSVSGLQMDELSLPSLEWLVRFLCSNKTPRSLNLVEPKFLQSSPNAVVSPDAMSSNLQHLNLSISCPNPGTPRLFNYLLSHLSELPMLTMLDMTATPGFGNPAVPKCSVVLDSLEEFLLEAPALQSLNLIGFKVDHEKLTPLLKKNSLLESLTIDSGWTMRGITKAQELFLDLLKNDNFALKNLHKLHWENPAIRFYLMFNKLGRAKLKDPTTTQAQLFSMLSQNIPQRGPQGQPGYHQFLEHHSLVYAILRECPGLWCMSSQRRAGQKSPKSWKTYANALAPSGTQMRWWYEDGAIGCAVQGPLALQHYSDKSPLFRISYIHVGAPGPAYHLRGVLCLPLDAEHVEITHRQKYHTHWLMMQFSPNSDCLDSIELTIPGTNETEAGDHVFIKGLKAANRLRASLSHGD